MWNAMKYFEVMYIFYKLGPRDEGGAFAGSARVNSF